MQDYKLYIYLLGLWGMLTLYACSSNDSDDFIIKSDVQAEEVDAYFQLQLEESDELGGLRSGTLDGDEPKGENEISILTFFVIDLDEHDDLDWTKVKYLSLFAPTNKFTISIKTTIGKKKIFVGANMSAEQITSFRANKGKYTSSGTTYKEVIDDFANVNGRGIVMFGQLTLNNNPIIEITKAASDPDNPLETELELTRVVAKVALTYTPGPDGEEFVKLKDEIDGFIDQKNIYFMLNNTSKSIDFISGMNPSYSKFLMEEYLTYNSGNSFNPLRYFYKQDPSTDFAIYAPDASVPGVLPENAFPTNAFNLPDGTNDPYHNGGLEKYEGIDIITGKHKHYASFRYCLENTVSTNAITDNDNALAMRHGINTKIIVAAKYTPGTVIHTSDPNSIPPTEHTITTEADMDLLTSNDPNGAGTFHAVLISDGKHKYYTYNAVKYYEENPPFDGTFIPYEKGYGYYATFISQPEKADEDDDLCYNLNRNHYYILNVTEFTPPGVVYPQEAYMLVNSVTTDWIKGKTTTIEVE